MAIRDISHLKQLDDLKTQMLTDTANKIRLPLVQAMNLLTEISNPTGVPAERMNDIVFRLVKTWKRIQQWADDLLELAQYESGLGIKPTAVNLSQLLNDIITSLPQDSLWLKRLKLDVNLPAGLSPVHADRDMLRKALQGIIVRAIARSEMGRTVRVSVDEQEWQLWIDITDGGAPITEADLPHVFERSFVGAIGGYDSTGLELATAKVIVDKLGGQIWVRSPEPVGSTITICLPTTAGEISTDSTAPRGS
jgi:signal transduction histidine kinase